MTKLLYCNSANVFKYHRISFWNWSNIFLPPTSINCVCQNANNTFDVDIRVRPLTSFGYLVLRVSVIETILMLLFWKKDYKCKNSLTFIFSLQRTLQNLISLLFECHTNFKITMAKKMKWVIIIPLEPSKTQQNQIPS